MTQGLRAEMSKEADHCVMMEQWLRDLIIHQPRIVHPIPRNCATAIWWRLYSEAIDMECTYVMIEHVFHRCVDPVKFGPL